MRKGVKPNPKKDSDARRKAKPTWRIARSTHHLYYDEKGKPHIKQLL